MQLVDISMNAECQSILWTRHLYIQSRMNVIVISWVVVPKWWISDGSTTRVVRQFIFIFFFIWKTRSSVTSHITYEPVDILSRFHIARRHDHSPYKLGICFAISSCVSSSKCFSMIFIYVYISNLYRDRMCPIAEIMPKMRVPSIFIHINTIGRLSYARMRIKYVRARTDVYRCHVWLYRRLK